MNECAPIILFVFNRPIHTKETIEKLKENYFASESNLFIFSDAAKKPEDEKKVQEVRKIISNITGFKEVHLHLNETNKGLANSIITGVSRIINEYGKVIVLEDDIITSKSFLKFMNETLDFYKNSSEIWSLSGYNFPIRIPASYDKDVYLSYRASSWGWGTWKDRWSTIDWNVADYNQFVSNRKLLRQFCRGGNDMPRMLKRQMEGKINSWAIRWCYSQSMQNKYTVYPVKSLATNIGLDNSGTHCDPSAKRFNVPIYDKYEYKLEETISPDKVIIKSFKRIFNRSIIRRVKRIANTILRK